MHKAARRLYIGLTSFAPLRIARRIMYSLLPGYTIARDASIGWRACIDVDSMVLEPSSVIGSRASLRGPIRVHLEKNAQIGPGSTVECTVLPGTTRDDDGILRLGSGAVVVANHYIDASGGVFIGRHTWIAGRGTQVWSHGLGVAERSVTIGDYCYVGTACRIAPGCVLGNANVVAMGSVLAGDHSAVSWSLLAGVPATIVRHPYVPHGFDAMHAAIAAGDIRPPAEQAAPAGASASSSPTM